MLMLPNPAMAADRFGLRRMTQSLVAAASAAVRAAKTYREKRSAARALYAMDDRMLKDIGVARSDIPLVAAGTWRRVNRPDGAPYDV